MARRLTQITDLDTGVVVEEIYRSGRWKHRDPAQGPSHIQRNRLTGAVEMAEYRVHGQLHREDGPASIWTHIDSPIVAFEEHCRRGRLHRDPKEGPAEINREPDGIVSFERFWMNGKQHRDPADGPAAITRDPATGEVMSEAYYVNGRRHRDPRLGPAVLRRHPYTGEVTLELYCVDGEEVAPPARKPPPHRGPKEPSP